MDSIAEKKKNANKQIKCVVCSKEMRSDTLKRHSATHKDLLTLSDNEVREELRVRQTCHLQKEQRRQEVVAIAHQEGIPLDLCKDTVATPTLDEEDLREVLLNDNRLYLAKIELGKKIAAIMNGGVVHEESLSKDRKSALELYRKQRPRFDIMNVELRAWQAQALQLIETPSERQVIWICGRQGNEGKTWLQACV